MDKREWAKTNASEIIRISAIDATKLPGMLSRIVPVALTLDGWYARQHEGKITFYEAV